MFVYYFVDPDLRVEIIFRKERTAESEGIGFEIVDIDSCSFCSKLRYFTDQNRPKGKGDHKKMNFDHFQI